MRSANAKHEPATLFLSIYPTVYTLYPHLKGMFREVLFVWTWNWKEAEMPINSRIHQSIVVFPACWNTTQHWKWITTYYNKKGASLVAQMVKSLPAVQETWVPSLNWEDPLEKEIATHSSTPAWKIPWTEEPGELQSLGSQRVRHNWATSLSLSHEKRWDGAQRSRGKIKTQKNI